MREATPAEEAAFATLEVEVGGRQALVAALTAADLSAEDDLIVGALADPQNDGVSLAKICAGGRVSYNHLMKLFQAAALAKGQAKAIARVAARLPDVAAAVMEDAIPTERVCPLCNGLTTIAGEPTKDDPNPGPVKCTTCKGKGTVTFKPDTDVRKMALQIGGLLDKGGGNKIVIAQQQVNMGAADSTQFDKLMTALDSTLYGDGRERLRGPVIDADTGDEASE